jgi:carbohydrate-binding DOMON domain-containing protein
VEVYGDKVYVQANYAVNLARPYHYLRKITETITITETVTTTVTRTSTVWSGRTVYAPTQTVTKYTTGIVTVTSYSPTITITVQGSGSSFSVLGVLGIVAFLGSVACARERKRHEH